MAFKAKNCPKCGAVYLEIGRNLCPECYKVVEKKELEISDYLKNNPTASADDIMGDMNVDVSMIRRMAREGYFKSQTISYPCKKCGEPIFEGDLCGKCLGKIQKNIENSKKFIAARKRLLGDGDRKSTYRTVRDD